MCSRWAWATALASLLAAPIAAQSQAEALRAVEAELDSIRIVSEHRDSLFTVASTTDTVVAGGLHVATTGRLRAVAQAAAGQAWSALVARFGTSAASRATIPVLQFGDANASTTGPTDTSAVARSLEHLAALAIWNGQDPVFSEWLRGTPPGVELSAGDRAVVAQELLRVPARTNLSCYRGHGPACAISLGLRAGPDTLAEWYPAAAWPRLATLVGGQLTGPELAAKARCEASGDPAACRTVLTPAHVMLPVSAEGRRFLLQEALEAGGDGAFERLTAAGERPIADRLSAAAGLPLDSLLTQWSVAIREGTPRGPARPAWELLLAGAWSAVLLAAVLGGPRWR